MALKTIVALLLILLGTELSFGQPVPGTGCMTHTANATSVSYSCTIAAGTNRAVALGIIIGSPTESASNILFAGAAVTSIGTATGVNLGSTLYRQVNPPTGSQTFTYNVSGFANTTGSVLPLTNVDQTTPNDTSATATGTNATPTVNVTSASNDLVVDLATVCCTDCGNQDGSAWLPGAGQTSRAKEINGDWGPTGMSTEAGAASVTMSWGCTGAEDWTIVGVSFNAPAAGSRRSPSIWFN